MAEGGGEETNDLVAALLARRFSRRSFQEKLDIIKRGRPTPALPNLIQQGKTYVRHFQSSNYERYPWLTGSEQHCRLYCWECMLFTTDRHGAWSHEGFVNLSCLTKSATKHQATAGHLQATVTRKTFGRARVDLQLNEQVRRETELHNENVKKNREILMTLIDSVIFLGKQELPFRGHDESKESTNKGNYVELLNFVVERDKEFQWRRQSAIFRVGRGIAGWAPTRKNFTLQTLCVLECVLVLFFTGTSGKGHWDFREDTERSDSCHS